MRRFGRFVLESTYVSSQWEDVMRFPACWPVRIVFAVSGLAAMLTAGIATTAESGRDTAARAPEPAAPVALDAAVDWTSLFLDEFAVGGLVENPYAAMYRAALRLREYSASPTYVGDVVAAAEAGKPNTEPASYGAVASSWDEREIFDDDRTPAAELAAYDAPEVEEVPKPAATGEPQPAGLHWLSRHFSRRLPAAPPSPVAAEVLKLRRAVGRNPIAGTIFDDSEKQNMAWVGDRAGSTADDEPSGEQTMAEAIRRIEEHHAATVPAPEEFNAWRVCEAANAWSNDRLRPAERKLEEAADLLEQVGQYERADAVRQLARKVRQDARECEKRVIWQQGFIEDASGTQWSRECEKQTKEPIYSRFFTR